ncbi:MAG: hypothetical protein Q9161_005935 [Pseudevernia consocians]
MHTFTTIPLAGCLAFLVNDAIVHAAISSSSISGASVNPSTITGTGFTISTATDTADGHQIGDEILGINDPTALQWLQNQQKQTCSSSKKTKRSVQCAVDFAKAGMDALSNDLQSLLTIKSVDKLAADSYLEPYIQTVFNEGRAIPQLAAVPDDTLYASSELLLLIFDNSVNHNAPIATVNIFPVTEFASPTSGSSSSCPSGTTPACPDSNCSGDNIKPAATFTPLPINPGNESFLSTQLEVLIAATSWASMNPLPSATSQSSTSPPAPSQIDTSLASTPPPVVCNRYPVGSCWSPTGASDVADAAQAFGNQLGSNIPAMREGGNNYTQVYKGGKVTYVLNMGWVEGCTLQTSQDPNNLMPNDATANFNWFFNHAFTDCKSEFFTCSGGNRGKAVI